LVFCFQHKIYIANASHEQNSSKKKMQNALLCQPAVIAICRCAKILTLAMP